MKSKEEFLQKERIYFSTMTDDEYKKEMYGDAKACKKCGIWYWNDCAKRCKCK
tara:strand:- start:13472 stop:13630 length:159 start_codon:yes stop_codon:yes gene_type:complete